MVGWYEGTEPTRALRSTFLSHFRSKCFQQKDQVRCWQGGELVILVIWIEERATRPTSQRQIPRMWWICLNLTYDNVAMVTSYFPDYNGYVFVFLAAECSKHSIRPKKLKPNVCQIKLALHELISTRNIKRLSVSVFGHITFGSWS